MCNYCKQSAFNTLIEKYITEYATNIWGNFHKRDEPIENDESLVFEMRCGSGYLRLGDRSEMQCIDHRYKFQINFCPMCGRKLGDV